MAAVKVDELKYVQLGVRGENDVLDFQIDISEWLAQWPDALYSIVAVRHDETLPYIAVTSVQGDILIWHVSESDTHIMGTGYMEVRATGADGKRKKTRVVPTVVDRSLDGVSTDVPEPMQDWVDQVLRAYATMMDYAETTVRECEAQLERAMHIFAESNLRTEEINEGWVRLIGGNVGAVLGDISYPVGSVFVTTGNVTPASLFGGDWEEVKGRMLLGTSTAYAAGTQGGSATITIAERNLPEGVLFEDVPRSVPN